MDQVANIWWPIGALTAPDDNYDLQENDLVYIVTSTGDVTSHRLLKHLKNEVGPFEQQILRLADFHQCIGDPESPDYVFMTQSGRVGKINKEIIRPVEPEEFEAIVFSFFVDIDNRNFDTLSEFLKFFGCATAPYIDSVFRAVSSGVSESMMRLRTTPLLQCKRERNIIGLILEAFYNLLHQRSINIMTIGDPTFFLQRILSYPEGLRNQMMPSIAFSEVALAILQQLLQQIRDEQNRNSLLFFDENVLMGYIGYFQKLDDFYTTLFDVAIENAFRKAAVRKAFASMEQYYEDKQHTTNSPYFLPSGGTNPQVLIVSFVEAIVNAPAKCFDIYVDALCFFLFLEPSLMMSFEDERFHQLVIPVLDNALKEKGSRRTVTFTNLLANPSANASLENYYVHKMELNRCFFFKEKMFCTLTCRRFGYLYDTPEVQKTVVLAPPAEYDKSLYSQITPEMRVTVTSLLIENDRQLEEQVPFAVAHQCYDYKGLKSLPRGFLRTWERSDQILKEHLRTLMDNDSNNEMHLAKFVSDLIHDSDDNARILFQCILETNKIQDKPVFENIFHTGVCWHLLIYCMEKCESVRRLFPEYAENVHTKFAEAMTSTMSLGTLKYYHYRLKDHFNEKQQKLIEEKFQKRKEAEKCFSRFINAVTDYTIDKEFQLFAKSHGYVFFTSFIYRFMNLVLKENDIHQLEKDLIIFRDTAFHTPQLRKRFADVGFRMQMGIVVSSTSKQLPKENVEHIFTYTWAQLHATDMIGRTKLEQFEKEPLKLDEKKQLGAGRQARAYLTKIPNRPFDVVAKIADDVELFYELSSEIDCLMRTQSHPHVLHLYGYVVEFGDHVGIVMEYCKGGTVQDVIDDPKEVLDEKRALHLAVQAASGLLFLHQHRIIHRDVKPDNMLLDASKSHLKISDLGISKNVSEKKEVAIFKLPSSALSGENKVEANALGLPEVTIPKGKSGYCGTEGFRAPEIWKDKVYSTAGDWFSLGRSIWHMIYRKITPDDVIVRKVWGDTPNNAEIQPPPDFIPSDELRSITSRLMNENVKLRLTMQKAYDELYRLYELSLDQL